MLMLTVWSGEQEAHGEAPGLSRYAGPSSLLPAIEEREGVPQGDGLSMLPHGQLSFWGCKPKRVSDRERRAILKHLKHGRPTRWIIKRVRCSSKTITRVRRQQGGEACHE